MGPQRVEVMALYRAIRRLGERKLVLTDKKYFKSRIQEEFRAGMLEAKPENRRLLFEGARRFLQRDLGGII